MGTRCRPCCTGGSGAFERGGKATTLELLPICAFLPLKRQEVTNTPQCGRRGGTFGDVFHVEHSVRNVPRGTPAYIYAAEPHKYSRIKMAYIFTGSINIQRGSGHPMIPSVLTAPMLDCICIQKLDKYAGKNGSAVIPATPCQSSCSSRRLLLDSFQGAARRHPSIQWGLPPLRTPSLHAPLGRSSRVCSAHCWVCFSFMYVIFCVLRQLSSTAVNL